MPRIRTSLALLLILLGGRVAADTLQGDLRFLGSQPVLERRVERARSRAEHDMRRLKGEIREFQARFESAKKLVADGRWRPSPPE